MRYAYLDPILEELADQASGLDKLLDALELEGLIRELPGKRYVLEN